MSKLSGLLLALVVLGGLAPSARAEEYETVVLDRNVGASTPYRLHARVLGTPAGSRPGSQGYARIEVVNPTDKAHVVAIRLEPMSDHHGSAYVVRHALRVEAGKRQAVDLPLPNVSWGTMLSFTVDDRLVSENTHISSASRSGNRSFAALAVGLRDDGGWPAYLESAVSSRVGGRRSGMDVYLREPHELPGGWTLLAGFDLVIVRAGAAGLTAERQDVLLRYLAGGGNLVVTEMRELASGPFVDCMRRFGGLGDAGIVSGSHGLGLGLFVAAAADSSTPAVRTWLEQRASSSGSILDRVHGTRGGGAPDNFWLPLAIPGLGDVPVRAFFLLILVFVILVGPVSYLYFRKRRRLAMLLVTIPVSGFLCAGLVLGYGVISEGFGIIGSARSFAVLDQETQLAAVVSGRTLYAGLQPDALRPDVDTVVASGAGGRRGGMPSLLVGAGHRLDGSVLPSRTLTPFVATTVGRSRERLRFRKRQDGGYDVLSAPGLQPVAEAEAVLLRTWDGQYFRSTDSGTLAPLVGPAHALPEVVHRLMRPMAHMRVGSGEVLDDEPWNPRMRYRSQREMEQLAGGANDGYSWFANRFGELRPGSYLARVRTAPLTETLGLDVEYRSEAHIVVGLLGPEDVTGE
ncbi:MAG: hypothetical protein AB7I45_01545 [Planctomycetota bacterium]